MLNQGLRFTVHESPTLPFPAALNPQKATINPPKTGPPERSVFKTHSRRKMASLSVCFHPSTITHNLP